VLPRVKHMRLLLEGMMINKIYVKNPYMVEEQISDSEHYPRRASSNILKLGT
jgi:hypothetical protein